jgi:hypothetical protein
MTADSGPSHAEILTRVDLFTHLDRAALDHLVGSVEIVAVDDGSTVYREGDAAVAIYVVSRGRFGVFMSRADAVDEVRVDTLTRGDYFGETVLLDDSLPTPTIRAEGSGELLRLSRDRALELLRLEPAAVHAIRVASRRRLSMLESAVAGGESEPIERQAWDPSAPVLNRMAWAMLGLELERLPADRRRQLLEISVLEEASLPALQALVGEDAETVAQDLTDLGVLPATATGPSLHALRERFAHEVGLQQAEAQARMAATRLARAGRWDDSLAINARLGDRAALVGGMGIALRAARPLSSQRAMFWVEQIQDDDALADADVLLIRASLHERDGNPEAALELLERALSSATGGDASTRERLTAEVARLEALRDAASGPGKSRGLMSSLQKWAPGFRRPR